MIIYNITTKVHSTIDEAWLQWQRSVHIPEVMATCFFTGYKLLHLLEQDNSEGNTYAVQYTASSVKDYEQYMNLHAPVLRKKALEKWGDKTISFRSVLEVIQ